MDIDKETDVIIVGGGVVGIWLSYELTKKGIGNFVFDYKELAGYSSTKNQGWVHCGSLYAALDQPNVAEDCKKGQKIINDFINKKAPKALRKGIKCFYMLRDQSDLEILSTQCKSRGIKCNPASVASITSTEPYVGKSTNLQAAARLGDQPVNTELLLDALATEAQNGGSRFAYLESPLYSISIKHQGTIWTVECPEATVSGKILVLACGVMIPDILKKVGLSKTDNLFKRTKVLVTILSQPVFRSLLIIPFSSNNTKCPNISPFYDNTNFRGVSICMYRGDKIIANYADENFALTDKRELRDVLELEKSLQKYYPKLKDYLASNGKIGAHFYGCQKIELNSASSNMNQRRYILLDHSVKEYGNVENLYSLYAGKFTTAPLAAQDCANKIHTKMGKPKGTANNAKTKIKIAKRRYFEAPTWFLTLDNHGNIVFEKGS